MLTTRIAGAIAGVIVACAAGSPAIALNNAERARLVGAIDRGVLIYEYDQAAWHSTDAMLKVLPRSELERVRGWVVEEAGDVLRVTYEHPAGGHYRLDLSPDDKVVETRAFTRSCISLGNLGVPAGATPAAAFITHVMDPTPTEIHVFLSPAMKQPLYVATVENERLWEVNGNQIKLVDEKSLKAGK